MVSREPVLVVMSVLAGMQALIGAAGFAEAVPRQAALWMILATAAVQAGVQFYVRGQVTPVADPRDADGRPLTPEAAETSGYTGRHRPETSPTISDQLAQQQRSDDQEGRQ